MFEKQPNSNPSIETIVDIGGGNAPHPNAALVVDYYTQTPPGFKRLEWNLNKFPYPLKDESYDVVFCSHVLEHLAEPNAALNEFYRIAKKKVIVLVPHYSSHAAFNHIGHVNFFGSGSFETLIQGRGVEASSESKKWVGRLETKLHFGTRRNLFMQLTKIIDPIINLRPTTVERYFMPFMWNGIDEVEFIFYKNEKTK